MQQIFPILYADDTGLVSSLCSFLHDEDVSNTCEISRNINDELYCVQEWLNVNRLSLNVSKTKYMIFHHRQRKIDEFIPDIRINDSPIEIVTDFNFLGLQIDQHLNWNAHIQKCSNKISRTLGVMNRLKRYLPTKILRVLYNSLILPHLQYAILSWGSKLSRLSKLQKRATRVITSYKLDESMARRQLKSPQSLSGRSIPLVTFEAWSSIDMFAFHFVAIGPPLAEI